MHMQRSLQLDAEGLLFLDSRQLDLITISGGTQWRERTVIVDGIRETGAKDLFKMRTLQNDIIPAKAIARQEDPGQLVAEQNQALRRANISTRLGAGVRPKLVDLIGMSICGRPGLVGRNGTARIHYRM